MKFLCSFLVYFPYYYLEDHLRRTGKYKKIFHYLSIAVGVIGLIVTNIVDIFYFEPFFVIVIARSGTILWQERKA